MSTTRPAHDRAAIMRAAHLSASIYRRESNYRTALAEGLRAAWAQAKLDAEFEAEYGPTPPLEESIRAEIAAIEMKDRMSPADHSTVRRLRTQIVASFALLA